MAQIKDALSKRFEKKPENKAKMDLLAMQTASGTLSSLSGVFKVTNLTEKETTDLSYLLDSYKKENQQTEYDLQSLSSITAEVKAINNQAIILHGERIKKAQAILSKYKDGAFSSWLMATYGNRQTPYNFLQYYEFYTSCNEQMQKAIDLIPKQVVYSLATRDIIKEAKEQFILEYKGETKSQLLAKLRDLFPLEHDDGRKQKTTDTVFDKLKKLDSLIKRQSFKPTKKEVVAIEEALFLLKELIQKKAP